jgi:hypothetical protein
MEIDLVSDQVFLGSLALLISLAFAVVESHHFGFWATPIDAIFSLHHIVANHFAAEGGRIPMDGLDDGIRFL